MKKIVLFLFFTLVALCANTTLDYLNTLRTKAGLPSFSLDTSLTNAAQNHSAYMHTNNVIGHSEDSANSGYTGVSPKDRALHAGYANRMVGENVSAGNATAMESIDGLFSAIYHRLGFLNFYYDSIGIGNDTHFYTYDMGNHLINQLCQNNSYTGSGTYYTHVCADTNKKIKASDYINARDHIKNSAPSMIVWPPQNGNDIPPVFYEEMPDPLPNDSVSGYPISVTFNNSHFTAASPTVDSFTLEDVHGTQVPAITLMNKNNDPNHRFNSYQVALFPQKRLEWGSVYTAELIYTYNGTQTTKRWSFSTRSLVGTANRFYRIENNSDAALNVTSGQSYAIYVVPNDSNDYLGGVHYSYSVNAVQFSYIDHNTVRMTLSGSAGQSATFTFANGQKVRLTVAGSDSATAPLDAKVAQASNQDSTNSSADSASSGNSSANSSNSSLDTDGDSLPDNEDTDDDNDGISDVVENANGLNPLDPSDAQVDFDHDGFTNAIELSLDTDIRNKNSKPKWVPLLLDGMVTLVPVAP